MKYELDIINFKSTLQITKTFFVLDLILKIHLTIQTYYLVQKMYCLRNFNMKTATGLHGLPNAPNNPDFVIFSPLFIC